MKNMKKMFILILVASLVVATDFCIPVMADEDNTMTVGDMMTIDYFPMTRTLYSENASTPYEKDSNYMQGFSDDDMTSFFNIPDDVTIPNGYSKFEDLSVVLGGLAGDTYPYAGMAVTKYINTYYLYVVQYIDDRELVEDDFSLYAGFLNSAGSGYNSPGAAFVSKNSLYITRYALNTTVSNNYTFVQLGSQVHITADSNIPFLCDIGNEHGWYMFDSQDALWQNISSTVIGSVSYCTMPLYLGYSNNDTNNNDLGFKLCNYPVNFLHAKYGVDKIYSDLSGTENNGCNQSADFFANDRRLVFPNNTVNTSLTPETDPISIDNLGIWSLDIAPKGDLLNGTVEVLYTPTKALSDAYGEKVSVEYTFQLKMLNADINNLDWSSQTKEIINDFYNVKLDSYHISTDFVGTGVSVLSYEPNKYTSFSGTSILSDMVSDSGNDYFYDDGRKNNINSYVRFKIFSDLGLLSQTTNDNGFIYLSPQQGVSCCLLTVYAQAFYGTQPLTQISSATYDYLTGNVVRDRTVSSDNNNIEVSVDFGGGFSGSDLKTLINNTVSNMDKGGGVSSGGTSVSTGGNSSATGGQGGSVTNNNQDTINVKSNWEYFIEKNPDDINSDDNISAVNQFKSAYDIVTTPENNPINSDFVQFLFTSDLWNIYPFNLILGCSGMLVTVGIFTAILRLFRR